MKTLEHASTSATPVQRQPTKTFFDGTTKTDAPFFGGQQATQAAPFFNPQPLSKGSKPLASLVTVQKKGMIQRGAKEEAAKATLKGAFHLKSVDDGTASWTEEELTITAEALKMLPAEDKKVLVNLVLIRNHNIGGVASTTAGQFGSQQGVEDTLVKNDTSIQLSDLAFQAGKKDDSLLTIIHEVGHAVASLKNRTANNEANKALGHSNEKLNEFNAAADLSNPAVIASNAKNNETNALIDAYNLVRNTLEGPPMLVKIKALQAELAVLKATMTPLKADTTHKKAVKEAAEKTADDKKDAVATTMISAADAQKVATQADTSQATLNGLPKAVPATVTAADKAQGAAYATAVAQTGTDIEAFHTATKTQKLKVDEVDALIAPVKTQIATRQTEKANLAKANAANGLLAFFAATETAQDAYFETAKAQALAHDRSAQVQKFVDFVNQKKIPPNITKYAADNWPYKPEEFYAEAYSFFVTKKLAAFSPDLNGWFAAGNYKN